MEGSRAGNRVRRSRVASRIPHPNSRAQKYSRQRQEGRFGKAPERQKITGPMHG